MRDLNDLNARIIACRRCPRLVRYREQVARQRRRAFADQVYWGRPVPACGDPAARALIVGLAPGAHGSNRTGRMFTGDGSGDFLTPTLFRTGFANQPTSVDAADGLRLDDLYVVAVAHCAPPDNRPLPSEMASCRPYLVEHLRLLTRLRVIVALGQIAFQGALLGLEAFGIRLPSPRPRFAHGAEFAVGPFVLVATYHPSRQNTQTGRLSPAMFDAIFSRARDLVRWQAPTRSVPPRHE